MRLRVAIQVAPPLADRRHRSKADRIRDKDQNEKEAWETLCRLIVLQTAVAREQITPEAHIVDYLGID